MRQRLFAADLLVRNALRMTLASLFQVRVVRREEEPASGSGWIYAGVPHRNWVEPAILLALLSRDRRIVTIADGPTVTSSWWRRAAARAVGGAIPIGRGRAADFERHLHDVTRTVRRGDIVAIFPEKGPPARAPRLRPLAGGVARFAQATSAQVVPVVFGGTDELYLGRRIVVRVLAPVAPPPANANRAALAEWMASFRNLVQAEATEAHTVANARQPRHKRWLWLTGRYPRAR